MTGLGFIILSSYLVLVLSTTATSTPLTTPEEKFERILVDIIGVPPPSANDAEPVSEADIYRLINEFQNEQNSRVSTAQEQGNVPILQGDEPKSLPSSKVTAPQLATSSKSSPVTSQQSATSSKSSEATAQQSASSSSKFSDQSSASSKFSGATAPQSASSSKFSPEITQSTDSSVIKAAKEFEIDVTTVLIIGVTAASLLVVLTVVVVAVLLCRKKSKKDFFLNKDVHTWDPQVLRPEKKNIDAFIFGRPIPTVDEMIQQG